MRAGGFLYPTRKFCESLIRNAVATRLVRYLQGNTMSASRFIHISLPMKACSRQRDSNSSRQGDQICIGMRTKA